MTENLNRTIKSQRQTLKGFNLKMEQLQEENRKLREERDYWQGYGEEGVEIENKLRDELQSAQQENENLEASRERWKELATERGMNEQKLIEGLREFGSKENWRMIEVPHPERGMIEVPSFKWGVEPWREAQSILQEIEVTVE